jgi:hypothetical protein
MMACAQIARVSNRVPLESSAKEYLVTTLDVDPEITFASPKDKGRLTGHRFTEPRTRTRLRRNTASQYGAK